MEEIFKEIPGYDGLYEVSNKGNVRTIKRQGTDDRILAGSIDRTGYKRVALCKKGITKSYAVHRLVCLTFLPNPNGKRTVNHIDGNKLNNILSNLEWMTHSENHKHAYDFLSRKSHMNGKSGKDHHNSKSVIRVCKLTKEVMVFDSLRLATASVGGNEGHVSACCTGKRKSHKGYTWSFADNFPNPEPRLQALLDKILYPDRR